MQQHFRALVFKPAGEGAEAEASPFGANGAARLEGAPRADANGAAAAGVGAATGRAAAADAAAGGSAARGAAAAPRAGLAPLTWWEDGLAPDTIREWLEAGGLRDAPEAARLLVEFRGGALLRRLDAASARRLHRLLPELLDAVLGEPEPLPLLKRFLRVIEAIGTRSTYFALLNEAPAARRRFVDVCRSGEFLAAQIAAHPLLLDELLDDRVFGAPPSRAEFEAELLDRIARVDAGDPERLVEALCQFKRAAIFRIAIADLSGALPLMRVSDRLTDVAELIVEQAMAQAWAQMTAQFGTPLCGADDARREVRVCAIGYGKLGGIELGYASDLDLVFLHDSAGGDAGDRCREAGRQPGVLRAPGAAHRAPADDALGGRQALRGRRPAAPLRQGRHADHQHRRVRRLPAQRGMDLGTPGAAARPRRGRLGAAARRVRTDPPRDHHPRRAARHPRHRGPLDARADAARALEGAAPASST